MRLLPRRTTLTIAALATATVGFLAPASPATAATTATVDFSKNVDGVKVKLEGRDNKTGTRLFGLKLSDGKHLQVYCIDLVTSAKDGATMVEDDWENYPNPDTTFKAQPEKVNWILHNSYPNVGDLSALAGKVGVPAITIPEAIAATQAAIWHYSNDAKLDNSDNSAAVKSLYAYLTNDTINVGLPSQPLTTLALDPKEVTGTADKNLGPITVNTTAELVQLAASSNLQPVNEAGQPVTTAKNGDKVFLKVLENKPGTGKLTATATAAVQTGRLFRGDGVKTQTLIVAKTQPVEVKDEAKASWGVGTTPAPSLTPAPSSPTPIAKGSGGNLAVTGSQVTVIAIAGGVLLAAGAGAVFMARRRKTDTAA